MTDNPPNPNPDPMTPERLLELELDFELSTPKLTAIRAKFTPVTLEAVPELGLPERGGVVLTVQVPNSVRQFVLEREDALRWSRELKKAAQGGSDLALPGNQSKS